MNEDEVWNELDQLKSRISFLIGIMQKKLKTNKPIKAGEQISALADKESLEDFFKRKAEEIENMELAPPKKEPKPEKVKKIFMHELLLQRIAELYKPEERFAYFDIKTKVADFVKNEKSISIYLENLVEKGKISKEQKYGVYIYWIPSEMKRAI